MFEKIKKIFKKKPKAEKEVKQKAEPLVLVEYKTFENEIVKPQENETVAETKSETKSSLTFGE